MNLNETVIFMNGMLRAKELLDKKSAINHFAMELEKIQHNCWMIQKSKEHMFYFDSVDLSKQENVPSWMTRCFKSTMFVVMINDNAKTTKGDAIRVMVRRNDEQPIENHWKSMQIIKNQLFGKETTAIEYYPAESELVDQRNIYWMWIFPNFELPLAIN